MKSSWVSDMYYTSDDRSRARLEYYRKVKDIYKHGLAEKPSDCKKRLNEVYELDLLFSLEKRPSL